MSHLDDPQIEKQLLCGGDSHKPSIQSSELLGFLKDITSVKFDYLCLLMLWGSELVKTDNTILKWIHLEMTHNFGEKKCRSSICILSICMPEICSIVRSFCMGMNMLAFAPVVCV